LVYLYDKLKYIFMKKLLIISAILLFVACEKEAPITLTLANSSMMMYNKDKNNIGASTNSTNPITYTTSNKWIASVDATGIVEAGVLGTAEITVSNGISSKKCNVEVKPKFTSLPEPYFNFGATRTQIKSNVLTGKLYDLSTALVYAYNEGNNLTAFNYYYLIGTDGKLMAIGLEFSILSSYATNLSGYITERYIPLSYSGTNFYYINKEQNMAIDVDLTYNSSGTVTIIFAPYTGTPVLKSGISYQINEAFLKTLEIKIDNK